MKKILVISNLYPSDKNQFYGTFVQNFVESLKYEPTKFNVDTALIRGRSYNLFSKFYKYFLFYLSIIYKLFTKKYDIIYVHIITHASIPLRFASLFLNLRIVFNVHGEDLLVQSKLAKLFLEVATPLLRKSALIVIPSAYFKQIFLKHFPEIDNNKIFISPSGGFNEKIFFPKNLDNFQRVVNIGYVSRIDRGKGWELLLELAILFQKEDRNLQFFIVGTGNLVPHLLNEIKKNKITNLTYLGSKVGSGLGDFYRQLDIFIFPTLLNESLGLVGIEALACGVPVIGSRIGGLTDYVKDGYNGYLCTPGNATSFYHAIKNIINFSPEDFCKMSNNSIESAIEFKSVLVNKNMNNLLNDL